MKFCLLLLAACVLALQVVPSTANCGCNDGCNVDTGCCSKDLCSDTSTSCGLANTCCGQTFTCTPSSPGSKTGTCTTGTGGTCPGGGNDPWFVGFDREMYEFTGYPHHYFAILSDANIQVNAWFAPIPEHPEWENANSMQQLGFMVGQDKVNITELDYQKLAVEINGQLISVGAQVRVSDGLLVTYTDKTAEAPHHSEVVTITTDDFQFTVSAPPPWMHTSFRFDGMGLALQSNLLTNGVTSPTVHGVLGLTLNPDWVGKVANKPYVAGVTTDFEAPVFAGPGSHRDYEVSGLFATDFKFSAYTGQPLARKQVQLRSESRKLMADNPEMPSTTEEASIFFHARQW